MPLPQDELLLALLQQHQGIDSFLDTVFDFLRRKTDLCRPLTPATEGRPALGFPEGEAARIVAEAFDRQLQKARAEGAPSPSHAPSRHTPPPPGSTQPSSTMSTWNGGEGDGYRWTQTGTDVTVEVALPGSPCPAGSVSVSIEPTHLRVTARGESVLEGTLPHRVRVSESSWTLEDRCRLVLTLEKTQEQWWTSVLKGHAGIDASKIESVKNVSDFPDDVQATIRKILHDQTQKARGLPTSDEADAVSLMREAATVEGAPEFDPASLQLTPDVAKALAEAQRRRQK